MIPHFIENQHTNEKIQLSTRYKTLPSINKLFLKHENDP